MLIKMYRLGRFFYLRKFYFISKIIYKMQFFLFNTSLPHSASVQYSTRFAYGGIGCVIHARAVIGDDCVIGQGVTIGGKSKNYEVPIIGDNVFIGAGARILGPIRVGNDCIIAPNAVVVKDVKENSIVGGVPAKVIREDIEPEDYI